MRSFEDLLSIAADRKGGQDAVLENVPTPRSAKELAEIPDDRWLAALTRGVFNAGFISKVITSKWEGFEAAFEGFQIAPLAMMSDDRFDALLSDTRIVRNGAKIASVRDNAVFLQEVAEDAGSFGKKIAEWPNEDYAELLIWLGKEGARLGGLGIQYTLRSIGRDGWILSPDVTARLIAEGVLDKPAGSAKALRAAGKAFNTWADQSGLPLTTISRVVAQTL